MKKIIIVLAVFFFDRATKMYLINLQTTGTDIDFYIFPFLNFYLVWNTGIGFGLASLETNIFYHILTAIIAVVNLVLIFFLLKAKGIYIYLFALIIGVIVGTYSSLFIATPIMYDTAKKKSEDLLKRKEEEKEEEELV